MPGPMRTSDGPTGCTPGSGIPPRPGSSTPTPRPTPTSTSPTRWRWHRLPSIGPAYATQARRHCPIDSHCTRPWRPTRLVPRGGELGRRRARHQPLVLLPVCGALVRTPRSRSGLGADQRARDTELIEQALCGCTDVTASRLQPVAAGRDAAATSREARAQRLVLVRRDPHLVASRCRMPDDTRRRCLPGQRRADQTPAHAAPARRTLRHQYTADGTAGTADESLSFYAAFLPAFTRVAPEVARQWRTTRLADDVDRRADCRRQSLLRRQLDLVLAWPPPTACSRPATPPLQRLRVPALTRPPAPRRDSAMAVDADAHPVPPGVWYISRHCHDQAIPRPRRVPAGDAARCSPGRATAAGPDRSQAEPEGHRGLGARAQGRHARADDAMRRRQTPSSCSAARTSTSG